jgi:hypothetical protein
VAGLTPKRSNGPQYLLLGTASGDAHSLTLAQEAFYSAIANIRDVVRAFPVLEVILLVEKWAADIDLLDEIR